MSGAATTTYQALYRACIKEAASQGRVLMHRLIARAGDTLPQRAKLAPDEPERKLLREAAHTLLKHEGALCDAYPTTLLEEFAHAISGTPRKHGGFSFDSLELMGDEQMRESVELMRIQQAVASQVEAELTALNALVSAVQGLQKVQPERNPLRPEVYVRALRAVVHKSPVPQPIRTRWLLHLGEALGPELTRLYHELADWLRAQGVAEARFVAVPAPETAPPPASAALAPRKGVASTLNLKELRWLLSGEIEHAPAEPEQVLDKPVQFSATMPAALEALQDVKQLDRVMQRVQQQPRSEGRATAQLIAQEVVTLMVDNIASDPRLLPSVAACVRELEPTFKRLALEDPRFFSDRTHPARRLLEEMTERSLAWASEDAPGFRAFIDPLQQAVQALRETRAEGSGPFEFALQTLHEAWGDAHVRERQQRERAVRVLLQAEQRNLLAEKIAKELHNRPDVQAAPREVIAFVIGPWAQVISQARLSDASGSPDPGGYARLVTDLVWSSQPKVVGTQTARLLKMVPQLVATLREGLASIDFPEHAMQRFLDWLADTHKQALRGVTIVPAAPSTASDSVSPALAAELDAMFAPAQPEPTGAWLAPSEVQHSGFMEPGQTTLPARPLFTPTQPATFVDTRPEPRDDTPDLPVADLQPGAWVEMLTAQGWTRFQVTWASPHGTLFMFTSATGHPQSMTRRLLAKMLQGGTLRLVSAQAVVDGALDAVAQKALQNSLDISL